MLTSEKYKMSSSCLISHLAIKIIGNLCHSSRISFIHLSLGHLTPIVHSFLVFRLLSVGTNHSWPWFPYKPCHFGDALTQSYGHNDLAFQKVTHVFPHVFFFCIQYVPNISWPPNIPQTLTFAVFTRTLMLFASCGGTHKVLAHQCITK